MHTRGYHYVFLVDAADPYSLTQASSTRKVSKQEGKAPLVVAESVTRYWSEVPRHHFRLNQLLYTLVCLHLILLAP